MKIREIAAAFVATAVLILSLSSASAACELACALGQLGGPCDSRTAVKATSSRESMPTMLADQSRCKHSSKSAQSKQTIPPASASVGSHPRQACNTPAALTSLQLILKSAPLYSTALAVSGYIQPDNISTIASSNLSDSLTPDLSALGPPLVSLRI